MRVERLEHAADGAVDQPVGFDLADVIGVDRAQRGGKDLVLVRDLVFGRQSAPAEEPADQRKDSNREHGDGDGAVTSHDRHASR